MAKKKTGVNTGSDRLPNRKYVVVSLAAASTTVVYSQFDTMMGAKEGAGWLVSRVDIQPRAMTDGWMNSMCGSRFQLATGAQTDLLNVDNPAVVATIDVQVVLVTSGMPVIVFPVTWVGPVLIASRQLSCVVDSTDDLVPLQSMDMLFTIWYQWVKLGSREWVEIAEAKGIG